MTIPYLAPRERELARLIVQGMSNQEIGTAMGISPRYAQVARSRLLAKLKVKSGEQFIAAVWREKVNNGRHFLVD